MGKRMSTTAESVQIHQICLKTMSVRRANIVGIDPTDKGMANGNGT